MTEPSSIDAYRFVADPDALKREGLFVAEGRLVVERLLEDRRFRVHSVLVTPAAQSAMARAFAARPDVAVYTRAADTLQEITGFDFHRGCLALAHRSEAAIDVAEMSVAARVLAIEGVRDPDNVGGLFRTALAFGVGAVLTDETSADPLYRKAVRTSMAAALRVPFRRDPAFLATLRSLGASGTRIIALTPRPDAVPLAAVTVEDRRRIAIVVGSEGEGLQPPTLALSDVHVRIPVDGRADSLNVVNAAAIALYALRVPTT